MKTFTFFSYSAKQGTVSPTRAKKERALEESNGAGLIAKDISLSLSVPQSTSNDLVDAAESLPISTVHLFSFRNFSFSRPYEEHKHAPSTNDEPEARTMTRYPKRFAKPLMTRSTNRAKRSALVVRAIIIGPSLASPKLTAAVVKPQLNKVKSQLMQPSSANKVIAQLRTLSVSEKSTIGDGMKGPIHAVCLAHTDAEEDALHFVPLARDAADSVSESSFGFPGVNSAPFDQLSSMFNEMRLIDLITTSDLGIGQPGDGPGLLAGAIPTAETVINGVVQITPELMALGYATGRAVLPNHTGIYPPTDRMSVLTYWWGLELVLPPPSLIHLADAQSIANTTVNFLSALALINNGVREILPFVRYIAQFIEFEFNSIKKQNKGEGVVCAATWIMPAAMVPRPWDFPPPPPEKTKPIKREETADHSSSIPVQPLSPPAPDSPTSTSPLPSVVITSPSISTESVPSKSAVTSE